MKGTLYLLPASMGDEFNEQSYIAPVVKTMAAQLKEFIVEDTRTARRFLKKLVIEKNISECVFHELDKHAQNADYASFLSGLEKGTDAGLMSEAGLPCIADPGNVIVKMCHSRNIRVVPLPGPSSILLALISSGLNGQNFTFHGYLPFDKQARIKALKEIEQNAVKGYSQIVMDTPYRNQSLLSELLQNLPPDLRICIATNINLPSEIIKTRTVSEWKKSVPDLHKQLVVFVIGK